VRLSLPSAKKNRGHKGNKQEALNYLKAYAQSIHELSYDYSSDPVFNRLIGEPKDTSYIKKLLAQSILIDREYTALKDEPRYSEISDRLCKITESQTCTFHEWSIKK